MAEPRYRIEWTTEVTEQHRTVITLDEIEKAHPALTAALREGRPIEDGTEEYDELGEFAAGIETVATQSDVSVTDRTVGVWEEEGDA